MSHQARILQWIERLEREELPVLAHTTKSVAGLSESGTSSAQDLAKVILLDSTMTTRVLRLANSVTYNPWSKHIDTVTQAIVVLGFEKVRSIAFTVCMLEDLLNGPDLKLVQREIVLAYQAAITAQRLAIRLRVSDPESVYIATLLNKIGPILFWSRPNANQQAKTLDWRDEKNRDTWERSQLGFTLNELTLELVERWNLSHLLQHYLQTADLNNTAEMCLDLSYRICKGLDGSGGMVNARHAFTLLRDLIKVDSSQCLAWLEEGVALAKRGLCDLGVSHCPEHPDLSVLMPPETLHPAVTQPIAARSVPESSLREPPLWGQPSAPSTPSGLLQLGQTLNQADFEIHGFIRDCLSGIKQELLCSQTYLLTYRRQRNAKWQLKHALGHGSGFLGKSLVDHLNQPKAGARLPQLLTNGCAFYQSRTDTASTRRADCAEAKTLGDQYLCHPIKTADKFLGYVIAARQPKSPILTAHDFAVFSQYGNLLNLAFRIGLETRPRL